MEKNFNFTRPFAMRCNAEQFESVRKEFIQMGYETEYADLFDENRYLINNYARRDCVTNISEENKAIHNRLIVETFNRDLCLALAAMTDKPDGITGEWWIYIGESYENFTFDKIYRQQKDTINQWGVFIDNRGVENGFAGENKDMFRKATADELIKYFTEAKLEQNQPETDPQIIALQKRIEDLECNVKQLAENMQNVKPPEPQPASRFADKQPLIAWDDDWKASKDYIFWDAKNEKSFSIYGRRNGFTYDNYEPIPADQIPAWMIEAAKHLKD